MLIYDDVEQLVADMFHTVEANEDIISVIADKDLVIEIMRELLTYNTVIDFCDIDSFDYNSEYRVYLKYDDEDENYQHIGVDQIYNKDTGRYLGLSGYLLLHEDINSKALIDIQNNEMSFLTGHDWFVIGEDDSFEADDENSMTDENTGVAEKKSHFVENPTVNNSVNYYVNGKKVNKEVYDKASSEFDRLYHDTFDDFLLKHTRLVDFVYGFPRRFWI